MSDDDRRAHWERVHREKEPATRSWFEEAPRGSLAMVEAAALAPAARVIDVGGGTSRLVEALIQRGYRPTVLDISAAALDEARERLGSQADAVEWVCSDITSAQLAGPFDLWHDRAVFHFLIDEGERAHYVELLRRVLRPGGQAIIATFAEDGPTRCSGLPTARYDAASLQQALGSGFELLETRVVEHHTPAGGIQRFRYNRFRYRG